MNNTLKLWESTRDYDLDFPYDEYCFSLRLANENAWTVSYTEQAILEYKKFMYLAAISDEMVSPSEIVDAVWHQHLIFTKSYTEFCKLLGKRIEHVPSTHNPDNKELFEKARDHTKTLYEQHFGTQPPEIWQQKEMLDGLGLKKAKYKIRSLVITGIVGMLLLTFPLFFFFNWFYPKVNNPYFILLYLALMVGMFVFLYFYNRFRIDGLIDDLQGNPLIRRLEVSELAYLKYENLDKLIYGHVNNKFYEGKLLLEKRKIRVGERGEKSDLADKVILDQVERFKTTPYSLLHRHLKTKAVFRNTARSMRYLKKYLQKSAFHFSMFRLNLVAVLFVFLLGFERVLTGLAHDKNVAYLVFLLIFYGVIAGLFLNNQHNTLARNHIPNLVTENIKRDKRNTGWQWDFFILGSLLYFPGFKSLIVEYDSGGMKDGSNASCGSGSTCGSSCGGGGSCGSGCGGGCGGCGS